MGRSATTLTDVARAAGVSLSTASLAFSGAGPISSATREKVLAAAAELGYHGPDPVAASLRRGRSGVIGVVMGSAVRRSFRDPVSIQFLDGIVTTLATQGYGTLMLPASGSDEAPGSLLTHGAMDAAVLMAGAVTSTRTIEALRARGLPTVQIGGTGRQGASVRARDKEGMQMLGEHLRERGHTRVAVATLPWQSGAQPGPVDAGTTRRPAAPITARRLDGLRAAGVEPVAIWQCASLVEEGIAAGRALLASRPTALVGFSDLIAAGLLIAAREAGLRVPEDVAVAGFDGIDLPWLGEDTLTTLVQPIADMGRHAAEAALTLAAGGTAKSLSVDVELRVGTTT
ncbi:LacI family DNA-binding transcriptional regulator [Pseudactinotalea suaedae]|uniref:LacI family DNA-binding transcriptional regulator n=1 Tax=Pseudactinotalea suaedae TaxID=1524924 RepID=UPI0012E195F1|nr:LacI family DNA-binding transcriptional regulator [Pseudactinotalea suaedae]